MDALGQEKVIKRLERAIHEIQARGGCRCDE